MFAQQTCGWNFKCLVVLCKFFSRHCRLECVYAFGKETRCPLYRNRDEPRVGLEGRGKSRRNSDNIVELSKISQNFRKSRRTSKNLAVLPKISQNFENLAELPKIPHNFVPSWLLHSFVLFLPDQYYIQRRTADSFDLRDFFRLPTKTQSRHYNTTKLPYLLNRVHISMPDTPSQTSRFSYYLLFCETVN